MSAPSKPKNKIVRRIAVAGLGLALCVSALWAGFSTQAGANFLLKIVLRHALASNELQFDSLQGTLAQGIRLTDLRLQGPAHLPDDSTVQISQASTQPLQWNDIPGIQLRMENFQMSIPGKIDRLTSREITGQLDGSWQLKNLELQGINGLPEGSRILAQELEAAMPLSWAGLQRVKNGRIFFPDEDPIVLDLNRNENRVEGQLYTNSVDLQKLLSLALPNTKLLGLRGTLKDIHLAIQKTGEQYHVSGPLQFTDFQYKSVQLKACPAEVALDITAAETPVASGEVRVSGGEALIRKTPLTIENARITLKPGEKTPSFNLQALADIEGTRIKVKLTGSLQNPEITLSSDPPKSKSVLMIMLATGRAWKPAQAALEKGQVTADLVSDFIDYWMLGGLGNKLTSRFGIQLLSVKVQGATKGVEVQKAVRSNVDVSTGIEYESSEATNQVNVRQSIGASYQIDSSTQAQLEATRETTQSKQLETTGTNPNKVNDEVMLKIKKDF